MKRTTTKSKDTVASTEPPWWAGIVAFALIALFHRLRALDAEHRSGIDRRAPDRGPHQGPRQGPGQDPGQDPIE